MLERSPIPVLFPWVSYRPEAVGGFLFNPYMLRELALDPLEAMVVELCDGTTPADLIAVELARSFRTDRASAERRLRAVISKLSSYFALRWHEYPGVGTPVADTPKPIPRKAPLDCEDGPPPGCLSAPISILWEITHSCNLSCLHCLSAGGRQLPDELSTLEAQELIRDLVDLRVFSVTLGGGEPLMRPDLFELIEYATALNLGLRLTTNGYSVSPETLRRLEDQNVFAVQVSVDGLRETHDHMRNRTGSFDRATRALKLFGEAGYYTFMTVTVTQLNLDELPALIDLALELGVSTFKVGPVVPLGRALENSSELSLSHSQIREVASLMRLQNERLGDQLDFQMEGLFSWLFDDPPEHPRRPDGCGAGCSAGTAQVTVSYDGHVYPCPYIRDRSAGNVRDVSLGEIWNNSGCFDSLRSFDRNRLKGKCRDCAYRPELCKGGCRGAALAAFGDLYSEDPNCWLGV